jgi:hypothetical protein
MFNDDYSIIFSHRELVERSEYHAKSNITTSTNSETAKSHFTSDFSFRCKGGIPANLNLYAKDRENEGKTVENAFSMVTMSVLLSDFSIACSPTSKQPVEKSTFLLSFIDAWLSSTKVGDV